MPPTFTIQYESREEAIIDGEIFVQRCANDGGQLHRADVPIKYPVTELVPDPNAFNQGAAEIVTLIGGLFDVGDLPSDQDQLNAVNIIESIYGVQIGNDLTAVSDSIPAGWEFPDVNRRDIIIGRIILRQILRPRVIVIVCGLLCAENAGDPEEDRYFEEEEYGEIFAIEQVTTWNGLYRAVIGEGEGPGFPYARIPREAQNLNAVWLPDLNVDPDTPISMRNPVSLANINAGWILALRNLEVEVFDIGCFDGRVTRGDGYILERSLLTGYFLRFNHPVFDTLEGCAGF